MKTLWKLATCISVALLLLFNLYSCENNDKEIPIDNNKSSPVFKGKRVSRIYWGSHYEQWDKWSGYEFEYDDNQLTTVYSYSEGEKGNDGKIYKLYYEEKRVRITYLNMEYIFELDDTGYAQSLASHNTSEGNQIERNTQFSYSNGYLSSINKKSKQEVTYRYNWENGNIISYTVANLTIRYTYSSEVNEAGVLACSSPWSYNSPLSFFGSEEPAITIAYYAGILGMPIKNMQNSYSFNDQPPVKITYCWKTGWGESEAEQYGYAFPVFILK